MKKVLASGATLDITRAPFVVGHKLFKAVLKELKDGVDLKLGMKANQTFSDLIDSGVTEEALNTIKNAVFTVLASQTIEESVWECMARATYNGQRITPTLFDDEKIAEDFLEIYKEVAIFNLTPFGKSLASLFPGELGRRLTKNQS